jgi:hypothetical protein
MVYMFPPHFWHTYLDNLWEDVGRGANCWIYIDSVLITHAHPFVGGKPLIAVLGLTGGHDAERNAKRPQQPTPLGGPRGEDDQPSSSESAKWMPSSRAALSGLSDP